MARTGPPSSQDTFLRNRGAFIAQRPMMHRNVLGARQGSRQCCDGERSERNLRLPFATARMIVVPLMAMESSLLCGQPLIPRLHLSIGHGQSLQALESLHL